MLSSLTGNPTAVEEQLMIVPREEYIINMSIIIIRDMSYFRQGQNLFRWVKYLRHIVRIYFC